MVWYAGMRMPNKCRHKCRPSIHPRLVLLEFIWVKWSEVYEKLQRNQFGLARTEWSHVFHTYYSTHNTESLIIMRDVMPGKSCHRPTSQLVRWFRTWLSVGSGIECSLLFTVQSKQQNEIQLWQIEVSGSTWYLKKRKVYSIWDMCRGKRRAFTIWFSWSWTENTVSRERKIHFDFVTWDTTDHVNAFSCSLNSIVDDFACARPVRTHVLQSITVHSRW